MTYNFKDERIKFCLETYENSSMGKMFLHNIMDCLPREVYTAIDEYKNINLKNGKKKISLKFNKNGISNVFDSFTLQVQSCENIYSLKVFYSYFSSDLAKGEDTSRTILFAEHRIQKGMFTQTKREFSHYASLNKEGRAYTISFIDDVKTAISRGCISVAPDCFIKLSNLKSQKDYWIQDKQIYAKVHCSQK